MNSTVTLYKNSKLLPDKNIALIWTAGGITYKGIELYLSNLTSIAIADFQYVKHALSLSIRVNLSQSNLSMGYGAEDLNYCKIQNGEENPLYYFIVGKKWKGEYTVELSLVLDTLNSFLWDDDYQISNKSLVYREHKDRIASDGFLTLGPLTFEEANSSWSYFYTDMLFQADVVGEITNYTMGIYHGVPDPAFTTSSITKTTQDGIPGVLLTGTHPAGGTISFRISVRRVAYRVIHKPSEDIQAPKRKVSSTPLYDSYQHSWSLLYRNRDIPDDHNQYENPVECFLIPETPLSIVTPTSEGVIDSLVVESGKYMLMFAQYDPATINFNGTTYTPSETYVAPTGGSALTETVYAIHNNSGTLELYSGTFTKWTAGNQSGTAGQWTKVGNASDPITVLGLTSIHVRFENSLPNAYTVFNSSLYKKENATSVVNLTSSGQQVVQSTNTIDRTDPRNIKILKLPYAPCDVQVDSYGWVTLDPSWEFDSNANLIKLADPNLKFVHDIKPITNKSIITPMLVGLTGQYLVQNRSKEFESKLLHSDFHVFKFVYDSFPKEFHFERINGEILSKQYIPNSSFQFTFVMSRNIVSKFLFDFPQYSAFYIEETQDFNHIVCVARNNEEVLYNSQYLNYLRTGYNYDLKTKERTELTAGVGIGLNIAGLVASIGIGAATGNPMAIGAAVAAGIGLAGQLVNYAKTTAQNDQNIAQKLQEAQMQAVSVQNADDVDLLEYYCDNKAILMEYKVSDEMEDALFDLFHYCGYKVNKQEKPDITTRYWWNFLQADLVFVDTKNLNSDMEEDIKMRFKDGVTFLHYHGWYSFDQANENWETAIVPYLDTPEE